MGRGTDKWDTRALAEWLRIKHGVPTEKAMDIASTLYPHMREVMFSGRAVLLSGIATIRAEKVPAKERMLFGVRKLMPSTWKIKFTIAKTFHQFLAQRGQGARDLSRT